MGRRAIGGDDVRETKGIYRDWQWHEGKRGRIFQKQPGDPWQCEWYTGRTERHRRSSYTTDEAQAWQQLAEYQSERSVRLAEPPFTLADAAMFAGRRQRAKNNSRRWRDRCAQIVDAHLFRIIGPDFDLNNGDIADMSERYMLQRRKELAPSGRVISYANIRKELLVIYQGCRKARDHGKFKGALALILPENLDDLIAMEKARRKKETEFRPTEALFKALLEQATAWRRPWLQFGKNTGLDHGPVHRIRKSEILWDVGPYGAVPAYDDFKTPDRPRIVPLNADARWAVDQRMKEPGEFLFEPTWSSQAFAACMKRWCPKAGIPKRICWKDLRHWFVSSLGNVGAPQNHVAALVGHSSDSRLIEKVYQHLDPEALAATVNTMPTIVSPSKVRQDTPGKSDNCRETDSIPWGDSATNSAKIAG
jgi:hypothetical protein